MKNQVTFTDNLTGEKFTITADDVYYIMTIDNGTLIMLQDSSTHVVKVSFGAVCHELGYDQ